MRRPAPRVRLAPILPCLAAGLLLVAGLFGCGGYGGSFLTITITPDQVPADGTSTAKIQVRAVFQKQAVDDGTTINLTASAGSFDPTDPTMQTTSLSTTAGSATATWYPPQKLGTYKISGSFTDAYSQNHQATASAQVVAPPPVDGSTFTFSCAVANIGMPAPSDGSVTVPCQLHAKDVNGKKVVLSANRFGFMAEAGTLKIDPGTGGLVWVVHPGDKPVDVPPAGAIKTGEPRWTQNGTGIVHNPRDGIATLVVYTDGKPSGKYDAVRGEPYLDENDNGQWDPGEPYVDADGNGSYTGPSGAATTKIWRWVKILMTGPVDAAAPANAGLTLWTTPNASGTGTGSNTVNIKPGASATIGVTLLDQNLNPVASQPSGGSDTISITVDATDATVAPDTANIPANYMGFSFDPATGALNGLKTRTAYTQNQTIQFTITNGIDTTSATADEPWHITSVSITRTPFPGASNTSETLPPSTAPSGFLCYKNTTSNCK